MYVKRYFLERLFSRNAHVLYTDMHYVTKIPANNSRLDLLITETLRKMGHSSCHAIVGIETKEKKRERDIYIQRAVLF